MTVGSCVCVCYCKMVAVIPSFNIRFDYFFTVATTQTFIHSKYRYPTQVPSVVPTINILFFYSRSRPPLCAHMLLCAVTSPRNRTLTLIRARFVLETCTGTLYLNNLSPILPCAPSNVSDVFLTCGVIFNRLGI